MADVKFKFAEIVKFKTEVTITTPDGEQQKFLGEFLYLDDKAAAQLAKLPLDDAARQVWKGWDGIVGPDEQPLPFSEEQRELLVGHTFITRAVVTDYLMARQGFRAKN